MKLQVNEAIGHSMIGDSGCFVFKSFSKESVLKIEEKSFLTG